jgi:hypothetical protein
VSVEDTISNTFNWLTETTFYEWSESGLWTYDNPFNEGTNSIHVSYNSMDRWGSLIVLSATNHGVTIINREDNSVKLYIPNSIITNEISALHLDDNGDLYGVGREGGFVKKGSRITNFYAFSKGYSYPNRGDGYNAVKLNYHIGDYFPTAITTINSGNFIFNIYGRKLDVENNSGAVLEVNSNNWSYTLYGDENNIFDGTNGIVDDNSGGLYAQVPQIKKDNNGNSWCVNAFSENFNQPFAIMDNIGEWHHITAPDTDSYLPLDLDFSQNGDVWVAFIRHNNLDGTLVSSGGIKILDYKNTISDSSDDEWHELVSPDILPGGSNQDVYSLIFSETEGQEILWVMTANGVQGYIVNGYNLTPIYPQTFYGNIGITKGDRLKVDPQNNVWVITKHSGVKVIRANTERWPTEEGFTIENSPILSNIVYDVAFSKSGEAYLATHEGISIVHTPFGIEPSDYNTNEILVSPNPVKISESDGVSFFSIPAGSTVKVMTLDGRVVKSFKLAYNESAVNHWNCKLNNGDFLTSGIYYVVSTHPQSGNFVGKFAVIR